LNEDEELFNIVQESIDPLLDMTRGSPRIFTKKTLVLRTCVEKVLKKDKLTPDVEKMLREAIDRTKTDDEGISMRASGLA